MLIGVVHCSKNGNTGTGPDLSDYTYEDGIQTIHNGEITRLKSEDYQRDTDPAVSNDNVDTLVFDNTRFAIDMYELLSQEYTNVFFSPYSISLALAMTYAGAREETATQMAQAMRFSLQDSTLYRAFNGLDLSLGEANEPDSGVTLSIVNTTWAQTGWPMNASYIHTLSRFFGAGVNCLDYRANPESARETINDWVYEQTEECIADLLPPGSINNLTMYVLTNAIYFFGQWKFKFDSTETRQKNFWPEEGGPVIVDMMHHPYDTFSYYQDRSYRALQLPYRTDRLAMLIILPDSGSFTSVKQDLSAAFIADVVSNLDSAELVVELPRFEFTTASMSIKKMLIDMGMPKAFSAGADFSGISTTGPLFISDVLHKAYIKVSEEGTEAAGATAVIMQTTGMHQYEPPSFRANRPFIFCIRDTETNTVLFMGHVKDPGMMQ